MAKRGRSGPAVPQPLRGFIGSCELLGAMGLVLPAATRIQPWLTPLAAAGLVLIMAGAVTFHARRREFAQVGLTAVLLVLLGVTGYLRWKVVPL
jgi:putative oxidoreductase